MCFATLNRFTVTVALSFVVFIFVSHNSVDGGTECNEHDLNGAAPTQFIHTYASKNVYS